jgi:tetratricopeptide (TPR) repeat protein
MLMHLVEASTAVIKSRSKQLSVLAYYQSETERYTRQLENSEGNDLREGMSHLVDALKNEGDIMLNMGNARNAVKYYTKALRYLKRMHDQLGERELRISIGLARALLRIINRRAAAEQLLNSLLPLARKLQASNEVIEIENLLSNKNRNVNIMTLLKSIF